MNNILLLILALCGMNRLNAQSKPIADEIPVVPAAMQTYSIRLKPGQDLKKMLESIVQQERIGAGAILTCVGSLTNLTLRLANQEGSRRWNGHFEIVSLTGTLSINGSHLHLSVSDSAGRTIGGHLLEGCLIYTTAELVIGIMPELDFIREPDPASGYRELVIRKRKKK